MLNCLKTCRDNNVFSCLVVGWLVVFLKEISSPRNKFSISKYNGSTTMSTSDKSLQYLFMTQTANKKPFKCVYRELGFKVILRNQRNPSMLFKKKKSMGSLYNFRLCINWRKSYCLSLLILSLIFYKNLIYLLIY